MASKTAVGALKLFLLASNDLNFCEIEFEHVGYCYSGRAQEQLLAEDRGGARGFGRGRAGVRAGRFLRVSAQFEWGGG